MKKIISISFVVSLLSACATNEPPIYHWGNYQQSMYENMKQENFDPVEHIALLEKDKENPILPGKLRTPCAAPPSKLN